MNNFDPEQLVAALLASVRTVLSGGDLNEYNRTVGILAKEPVNVEGSTVYVVSSDYVAAPAAFAPFRLVTDTGRSVLVTYPFSEFRLGAFKRLTIENVSLTQPIEVKIFAGYGSYRVDRGSAASVVVGDMAPFVVEKTRPNNATQYAQGDQVMASAFQFSNVGRIYGGAGFIRKARLLKSGGTTLDAAFRLFLFAANPAVVADNAAYPIPYSASWAGSAGSLAGVIDFPLMVTGGAAGAAVVDVACDVPFVVDPASRDLWAVLVADAAYVPAAQEKFAVFLWADRY